MMQSEYSLSLDAVICRRCNAVSPAVNDTCPSCGADRQGAIFTSVTDQDAAAAPVEDSRDFVDLRDTGWLTRLARRKMVTSYPSLVEPGDALPSPERKPARKGLAVLVGGVVAAIAAGGYYYAQMDDRSASPPSVSVAGSIGNGASMPRDHGDADRPALDRNRTDDTAAQADRRDEPRIASASASAGTAAGRAASMPATAAVVAAVPSARTAPPSKPVAEIRVPAMESESPKSRDASRQAVADAIDLAAKRDAAPPNTATGAVVSQIPSHAVATAASQSASGGAPQSAQSAASVASSLSASEAPRAMADATPAARIDATKARVAPATPATSALAGSASSATVAATAAASSSITASAKPAAHVASTPLAATPATVPTLANRSTVVASQSATTTAQASRPTQTAPRAAAAATVDSSPAAPKIAPKPTPTAAPQTVAGANQAITQERPRKPDTDKSTAAPTQEAPSPAEARTIAAVRQALASRDLAAARRHLRGLTATQSRSPQIQQLAADVSRQERARDSAMANARSCAASHEPACAVRNARRAVALDPRNAQAQAVLKHAMTVQADANTAYFRQASALPAPAVPSMTFDGRWSIGSKSASASGGRSDASGAYTLFGWGVPAVSKGRGDAH